MEPCTSTHISRMLEKILLGVSVTFDEVEWDMKNERGGSAGSSRLRRIRIWHIWKRISCIWHICSESRVRALRVGGGHCFESGTDRIFARKENVAHICFSGSVARLAFAS